jgi:hypothetical protein
MLRRSAATAETTVRDSQPQLSPLSGLRLVGLNFFIGQLDAIGNVQFRDVKSATHGIQRLNKAEQQRKEDL